MNFRPTPTTPSDAQARANTPRMFVPGTVAALTPESQRGVEHHRRSKNTCGCRHACACSVPEILKHGRMASFLGNLGDDDDLSFDPTMYDPGSALVEPTYNDYVLPVNLNAPGTIDTTMYDAPGTLAAPNLITPSPQLQLSPSAPSSIPGTSASVAAGAASAASQLVRATTASPTARATIPVVAPATPYTTALLSSQLNSLLTAQSVVPGISNGTLMIGALLATLAFSMSTSKGKRR